MRVGAEAVSEKRASSPTGSVADRIVANVSSVLEGKPREVELAVVALLMAIACAGGPHAVGPRTADSGGPLTRWVSQRR